MIDLASFADLTVAVLMGGQSSEREVSFRSGEGVLGALGRLGVKAVGVDPGQDLVGQLNLAGAAVVLNVLHGGPGENGAIQGVLDSAGIPYAGSGVLASALAMHKVQTKRILRALGIPTPDWLAVAGGQDFAAAAAHASDALGLPVVVKPVDEGSSVGVSIVDYPSELQEVIADTVARYREALVERFVAGREITVGVLGSGDGLRALPVLELVPKTRFYDYEAKYTKGMTDLLCPADIGRDPTRRARDIAVEVHRAVGCHGISRVDMHLDEGGQVWVHEINSIPGMTEISDVPAEAAAEGMSYDELVAEVLASALPRMMAAGGGPLPPL
jgi:D-alanine-D-alanine ligase